MNPSTRLNSRDASFMHRIQGLFGKGFLTIILMIFTLIVLVPFIWMVIMSFRTTLDEKYSFEEMNSGNPSRSIIFYRRLFLVNPEQVNAVIPSL